MATQRIDQETVFALRDALRKLLDDEEARANSLNGRGSALTGFIGVILSVATAAGAIGAGGADELERSVQVIVGVLAVLALGLLVLALVFVVFGVLLPRPGKTLGSDDTDHWGTYEYVTKDATNTAGYLLNGYSKMLRAERIKNGSKATWLRRSYKLVLAGLAAVALAGGAATIDRYVGGPSGQGDDPSKPARDERDTRTRSAAPGAGRRFARAESFPEPDDRDSGLLRGP